MQTTGLYLTVSFSFFSLSFFSLSFFFLSDQAKKKLREMHLHRTYFLYWISIIEVRSSARRLSVHAQKHSSPPPHHAAFQIAVLVAVLLTYSWAPIALEKQVGPPLSLHLPFLCHALRPRCTPCPPTATPLLNPHHLYFPVARRQRAA